MNRESFSPEPAPTAAAHVKRVRLLDHLRALEGPRHPASSPERLARAQAYVAEQFTRLDIPVLFDQFSVQHQTFTNVIARPAATRGRRLIVGAHFDTVSNTPGADDDASGVAVMLEAARVIRAIAPAAPVEFVGFNLEEWGMLGSRHYAEVLKRNGEELLGMLSLEMVGFTEREGRQTYPPMLAPFFPKTGDYIGLAANFRSRALLKAVERAMRGINALPVQTLALPGHGGLVPEIRLSDHAPFWDAGYPALLVTDTAFLRNPHYHRPTDTVDTLDLAFMDKVCQGGVAAILAIATQAGSTTEKGRRC